MANTNDPNGFVCRSFLGQSITPVTRPLYTTQTITKGDAVIHTTGLVAIALFTSPSLLGVSVMDATTAADVNIKFVPGVPWAIFEGQCSGTYAAGTRFTSCDIEGTTGIMEVNKDLTNEDVIHIIGEDPNTEIGEFSRVLFIILRSFWYPVLTTKA